MTSIPNLRHLAVFCAVARLGSVSAAARAAHLSQPAVTQAVGSLEEDFGSALFARAVRGMELTAAGRLCAVRVSSALQRLEAAVTAVVPPAQVRGPGSVIHGITATQLQALVAAIDAGGFGPGARLIGMTRATIQRAARGLEQRVGVSPVRADQPRPAPHARSAAAGTTGAACGRRARAGPRGSGRGGRSGQRPDGHRRDATRTQLHRAGDGPALRLAPAAASDIDSRRTLREPARCLAPGPCGCARGRSSRPDPARCRAGAVVR
ncbi:MAG: LysR family transcriptional regulator [Gammaproteobacteria bacterium]|nr:LysR family transcriptional regulator [Gammaproteobacteria bacterium]